MISFKALNVNEFSTTSWCQQAEEDKKIYIQRVVLVSIIMLRNLPRVLSKTNCIPRAKGLSCSSTDLRRRQRYHKCIRRGPVRRIPLVTGLSFNIRIHVRCRNTSSSTVGNHTSCYCMYKILTFPQNLKNVDFFSHFRRFLQFRLFLKFTKILNFSQNLKFGLFLKFTKIQTFSQNLKILTFS